MRTTEGKATLGIRTAGEPELADTLATALAARERTDRVTHGFHTYPAGLHPDAARDLLAALPGDRVLDPFCGGGTVLVEALLAGRTALGRDLGPVAVLVSRVRTARTDERLRTLLRSTARRLAEVARSARDLDGPPALLAAVEDWYAPWVVDELLALRHGIEQSPTEVRELLWGVFSAVLVKVSWRRSDTSARREVHDRPPGTTAVLFHKKARELGRRLEALEAAVPEDAPAVDVRPGDASLLSVDAPVDLVLTSPPYPGVYDYLALQSLREAWLNVGADRREEIGGRTPFRRDLPSAVARWSQDTARWIHAAARALRPGGHLAIVVGDGLVHDTVVEAAPVTGEAAQAAGLEPRAVASLARPDHARGSARWEHALVFRKAPQ